MDKITCMIVDDEPLAIALLKDYIIKIPFLDLVEATTDALYALDKIQNNSIDLLFLDIQMPDIDGIQFMKIIQHKSKVILTTAYKEYALEGYKHSVIDYLLKPISFSQFYESTLKAKKNFNTKTDIITEKEGIQDKDFIFVKTDGKFVMVLFNEILYIEGLKDYILIHLKKEKLIVLENLKDIEAKLPSNDFKRIHRSFIVKLNKISVVEGNRIQLDDKIIPIGETYRNDFFEWINNNK